MQIGRHGLRAGLLGHLQLHGLLARGGKPRAPFAVAAVEHQNVRAGLETQHVDEIVRLRALQRHRGAFGQRGFDEQAGRAEIVARHALI